MQKLKFNIIAILIIYLQLRQQYEIISHHFYYQQIPRGRKSNKKQEEIQDEQQQSDQQTSQQQETEQQTNQDTLNEEDSQVQELQLKDIIIDDGLKIVLKKELESIKKTKNGQIFAQPVDWKLLGIPDYPKIIQNPMDFSTMIKKLIEGKYDNLQEFTDDYNLIFDNCKKYNGHTANDRFWKAADYCKLQLMKKLDISVNDYLNPEEESSSESEETKKPSRQRKTSKKSQKQKKEESYEQEQTASDYEDYEQSSSHVSSSESSQESNNIKIPQNLPQYPSFQNQSNLRTEITDVFMQPTQISEKDLEILKQMETQSWIKTISDQKLPKTFLKPMISVVKQNLLTECSDPDQLFQPFNVEGNKAILAYLNRVGGQSISGEKVTLQHEFDNMITVKLTDIEGIDLEKIKYKDDEDVSGRMYKKIIFDPINSYKYSYRVSNQFTFNSFLLQYITEKQYEITQEYEYRQRLTRALAEQCNIRAGELLCWWNMKRINNKNNKYSLINQQLEQIGDYVCKQGLQAKQIQNNLAKSQYWNKIKKFKISQYLQLTKSMVERIQNKVASFENLPTPKLLDMGTSQLRPYQFKGMKFMLACTQLNYNCLLADDLGLGKTLQTLALIAQLAENGIQGPYLIIVPSTLIYNWEQEIRQWCPWINLCIYYGSKAEREKIRQGWNQETHNNVILTSYNIAVIDLQYIKRKIFYYLILDEAHLIRNQKSKSWNALMSISAMHKLLISGTPISNSTDDIYSLLNFVLPEMFNKKEEFNQLFATDIEKMANGEYNINQNVVHTIHQLLRPFLLRRLKSEVEKELPKKTEYIVPCQLSRSQKYLYYEFMNAANNQLAIRQQKYLSVMNILTNLRRICNHPKLLQDESINFSYTCAENVYSIDAQHQDILNYQTGSSLSYRLQREVFQYMSAIKQCIKNNEKLQQQYQLFEQIVKRNELADLQHQHRKVFCITCNKWHDTIINQGRLKYSSIYQECKFQHNVQKRDIIDIMNKVEEYQNSSVKQRQFLSKRQLDYQLVRSDGLISLLYYQDLIRHFCYQVQSCKQIQRPKLLSTEQQITNLDNVPDGYFINQFRFAYENPLPKQIANISNFKISRNNIDCVNSYTYKHYANPFTIESTHSIYDKSQIMTYNKLRTLFINNRMFQSENNYKEFANSYPYTLKASKLYNVTSFDQYDINLVNQIGEKVIMPTFMNDQTQIRYVTGVTKDISEIEELFNQPYPNSRLYCKSYLQNLALQLNIRYMKCYKVGGFYSIDQGYEQYEQQQNSFLKSNDQVEIQLQNQILRGIKSKEWKPFNQLSLTTPLPGLTTPSQTLFTQQQLFQHVNPSIPNQIGSTMNITTNSYQLNSNLFCFNKKLSPFQLFTPNKCYYMNNISDLNNKAKQTSGYVYHTPQAIFQPQKQSLNQFVNNVRLNKYLLSQSNDLIKTSGKMQVLSQLLATIFNNHEKALIFTQSTSMLNLIELFIQEQNYSYYRMDGSTQPKQRQYLVNSFNNSQVFVFIMTTRTGGIGLNLTGANNVIFYDCDWNPQIHQQATDRVHRINQVRPVKVYTLVSEFTVEENIVRRATQKRHLEKLVLTDGAFLAEYFTNKQEYKQSVENRFSKQNTKLELIYNKLVNETALRDRLADVIEFYDNEEDKIAGQKLIQEVEGDVNDIDNGDDKSDKTEHDAQGLTSEELMTQINIYQTLKVLPAIFFASFQENYQKIDTAVYGEIKQQDCELDKHVIERLMQEEDLSLIKNLLNQGIKVYQKRQQQQQQNTVQDMKLIQQQEKFRRNNVNLKIRKIYWGGRKDN